MIRSEKEERFKETENDKKMEFIQNGNQTRHRFNNTTNASLNLSSIQVQPWTNPAHMERLENYLLQE